MFATLMESRSRTVRNELGTAASAAIHLTLIVVAAYVTTASAREIRPDDPPTTLRWVKPPVSQAPQNRSPGAATGNSSSSPKRRLTNVSLSISANIPDVSIPLGAVRADDFTASVIGTPGDGAEVTGAAGDKAAFEAYEVDSPVAALAGSARPDYPAALRSAGIEGEVTAQFIVDKSGRASTQSIRIVSATNELFAESVRRAIPRMRFVAARLHGEPVAQTVQQLFAFRLDR